MRQTPARCSSPAMSVCVPSPPAGFRRCHRGSPGGPSEHRGYPCSIYDGRGGDLRVRADACAFMPGEGWAYRRVQTPRTAVTTRGAVGASARCVQHIRACPAPQTSRHRSAPSLHDDDDRAGIAEGLADPAPLHATPRDGLVLQALAHAPALMGRAGARRRPIRLARAPLLWP